MPFSLVDFLQALSGGILVGVDASGAATVGGTALTFTPNGCCTPETVIGVTATPGAFQSQSAVVVDRQAINIHFKSAGPRTRQTANKGVTHRRRNAWHGARRSSADEAS